MINYSFLGYFNEFGLNMFMGTFTGFLFNQVPKIIWGKVLFFRKITDRRCTLFLRIFGSKIIIQEGFEIFNNALIYGFPSDKLPVIKSYTIIQK